MVQVLGLTHAVVKDKQPRPLTGLYETGFLKPGAVAATDPVLLCETCEERVDQGAIIYSFPYHQPDRRARAWHAQCFPQQSLVLAARRRGA